MSHVRIPTDSHRLHHNCFLICDSLTLIIIRIILTSSIFMDSDIQVRYPSSQLVREIQPGQVQMWLACTWPMLGMWGVPGLQSWQDITTFLPLSNSFIYSLFPCHTKTNDRLGLRLFTVQTLLFQVCQDVEGFKRTGHIIHTSKKESLPLYEGS